MVRIGKEELASFDIPEEQADILNYLSDDSGSDEESVNRKLASFEPLIQMDDKFPATIVMVGIPKVKDDIIGKLCKVLELKMVEELARRGAETSKDKKFEFFMPVCEETHMTKGCCFVTFPDEFSAQHAARILNKYKLDSKHKFRISLMDEFAEVVNRDQNYKPPIKLLGFTRENFVWWLLDPRGREQICLRYGDETEIHWHDPLERDLTLVYNGHRERLEGRRVWTDFRVQWSPQGSFLVTFHRPGVVLWAGENFEKKVRFEHKEVKQIEFSPNETYVITWDGSPPSLRNERAIRVWNVMSGVLLRQFSTPAVSPRGHDFPHFLFSYNDKYLAKIGDKELCVYAMSAADNGFSEDDVEQDQAPVKLLRDSQGQCSSLKYPVEKFEWSPADNIISVWVRGSEDAPGRLILVDIPSRRELSSKNVYNVKGATMHWHPKGDYFCLKASVYKKTGKKGRREYTQLEIFRMREKDIPVDNVQLNDIAVQLHWEEGYSKRFALIVSDEATSAQSLRFYRVVDAAEGGIETNKRDTILTCSFDISSFMNFFKWSPFGSYFILAALGFDGTLVFCHLNEQDKVEVLHQDEHFMVNEIKWSACGRYLATAVALPIVPSSANQAFRLESNSGFNIWTFQGKLLCKCLKDKFYQFLWRPHPPSLLKKEKVEEIKKHMKEYSKRYEAEDAKVRSEQRAIYMQERRQELEEFNRILEELQQYKISHPSYEEWMVLSQEFDAQFDWEDKEEIIEEELDVKQEIIR